LRGLSQWIGYKSIGISYFPNQRYAGKSKYNWLRMWNFAVSGIISFSKTPLRISAFIGACIAGIGFLSALYSIIVYFSCYQLPSGWLTLSTLISLLGGTQLCILGILGEYIAAIFSQVQQRPRYLIETIYKANMKDRIHV
tara:strand:- start:1029 stop:1448 length:420 start_codon:yes stop_codon:yes gene_type:complete